MRKTTTLVLTLLFLLLTANLLAADQPEARKELPIGFTKEELTRLDEIGINHIRTAPPPGPGIRSCAEWEPSEGVIIRYPFGISYSIIAEMSEDLIVYTIVGSSSQQTTVTSYYNSYGVNMDNVEFIIAPTNSYWTRDYGPWFIFDGNGDFGIVDPIYNRPRPQDDAIPSVIGSQWSIPVYGLSIETAGGNYMSDGLGQAMASTLTLTENPGLTEDEIDSMILAYMGNDYFMYPDPLGEYIEHIDCWGKFLSPQTVLVLQVPTYHSQYAELEAAADSIGQLTSAWGRPYTVVRALSSGSEAYTNSVILNKKVFVPVSGTGNDAAALQSYEDAMPGYEVLGFSGSWVNTDALHCRTMGVPDRDMLFIHHVPLFVTNDTLNDYEVTAKIVDHSNTGLIMDSCKIYYQINGGDWQYSMLTAGLDPYMYEGTIPAQSWGTEIRYYIQAGDNSGRVETHPYIGAPGAHVFNVLDINPVILLSENTFSFEAYEGDKALLYDTLTITNAGSGALSWEATTTEAWLSVNPGSGVAPSNVQIVANTNSIIPGSYVDTITVTGSGATNSPQYVEVTLTIYPQVPTVMSTSPVDAAVEVPIDANITATFSIDMDPETIDELSVLVHTAGDVFYSGTVTYDSPSKTMTFDPDTTFYKGERIFVQLTTDIQSSQGVPLSTEYNFDFYVETNTAPYTPGDPVPADGTTDVVVSTDVSWSGGDPDGDPVHYTVYFGTSNPPPSYATEVTETTYDLPVLDYDTHYYWYVKCYDGYGGISSMAVCDFTTELNYVCGDANGDLAVNVSDAVSIINFVFVGGDAPDPYESGDVNCDGSVNVSDAVWIINYVFVEGNTPCDTDGDDIPDC
jgi:agmatine deiminase